MIRAYNKSKLAAGGLFLLAVVLSAAVWITSRGGPIFVPILATVFLLTAGFFLGKLVGGLLATRETNRCLALLHGHLDPEAFLAAFEPVPGKVKRGTGDAWITKSYLADGYWAAGRFDEALAQVQQDPPLNKPSLRSLYAQNRCAYLLAKGDLAHAREAIKHLSDVTESFRTVKPALYQSLQASLTLYRSFLKVQQGREADLEWLQDARDHAPYGLRRLEAAQVLALAYERAGKRDAMQEQLDYLRDNGGKTFWKDWAEEKMEK